MSKFSVVNGLKMTWAHLHDEQMFFGWFMCVAAPAIACLLWRTWWLALIWFVVANMSYVLIRCWDDPVKLGWCDK